MPIFSKESLETLRQRIDLVDVLSHHLDMKKAGASYKTLCPFHDEKTSSFMVQKGDTHYHCFGCGAHGDAIAFLMNHLKMSFNDAVETLAERFQVHLEIVEGTGDKQATNKAALKEAMDAACRFFHFYLMHAPEGQDALQYLYGRDIDLDFIQTFQIGLAPATNGMLRKTLHGKFVKDEIMEEAGLIASAREGGWRDFFQNRITFPIRDAAGAVIGFSARKYKEETFGGKYVNTAETPLFKKSRVLFGLNYCRRRIAKERKVIIVEGQLDALRLIKAGFNITVAGQGTAFGEGHAKELIGLGINEAYLALDADAAGQEASVKIGDIFQREGVEVRVVKMPPGSDPDAYLRSNGAQSFMKLLQESADYLTFLVDHETKRTNIDSPAGKNDLVRTIARRIREWGQPLMVHESLRKLAQLTKIPEGMVGLDQDYSPNIFIKKSANAGLHNVDPDRILETDFLRWLVLFAESQPRFVELAKRNISYQDMRVPVCAKFYQLFMEHIDQKKSCDRLSLIMAMDEAEGQSLLEQIDQKKVNKDRAEQQYMEAMQGILNRNWMLQGEEIRMQIQNAQHSDDEAMELAKKLNELKRNQPKVRPL